jgi:hypothetical protein
MVRQSSEQLDALTEELARGGGSGASKAPVVEEVAVKKEAAASVKSKTKLSPQKAPGGALHHLTQGRDGTGKFLSSSHAEKGSAGKKKKDGKSAVVAKANALQAQVPVPAKSVRGQAVTFGIACDSSEDDDNSGARCFPCRFSHFYCAYG